MDNVKKPLKRSILISVMVFDLTLCLVISLVQFFTYKTTMYERCASYIENVLRYTASAIDTDDLAECIRTGEESEKYRELQGFLDQVRGNMDLHFLYVIIPLNTEPTDNIQNVIAAVSAYEYEFMADEPVSLNQLTGDAYSPATAKKYLDAYNSGELSFFEEVSQWGDDYTGLMPLYDSQGNKVAALCMDVDIREINQSLVSSTVSTVLIIVLLGLLFSIAFFVWSDVNISNPIQQLEASVVSYARSSGQKRDPDALVLHIPAIETRNEVESLANAVVQLSENMRDYVISVQNAQKKQETMGALSHRDVLTHVGTKSAYTKYAASLQKKVADGPAAFSIVLLNLIDLKRINETHGREQGDMYLLKCCAAICETFSHSPVFRVSDDEFAVVLTGRDYEDQHVLLKKAEALFRESMADPGLLPWEKLSVAMGIASYTQGTGEDVNEVYARADERMCKEKDKIMAELL